MCECVYACMRVRGCECVRSGRHVERETERIFRETKSGFGLSTLKQLRMQCRQKCQRLKFEVGAETACLNSPLLLRLRLTRSV